tara:strand:- start:5944 stop:6645 length:702 start_codon:yes stop_codon:yes gene_type:complete
MIRLGSTLLIIMILNGCASHPRVATKRMEVGEVEYGYAFSIENIFPYLWYRKGISDRSDIGFRVGLPIYGSGLDYSRLLYEKENKWDMLNIGWSLNPNSNYDVTYYKFKHGKNKKNKQNPSSTWMGLRFMYIPNGISDKTSSRIGLLFGRNSGKKISFELGYYHDFSSMPIGDIFSSKYNPKGRFVELPHTTKFGFPSENSRIVGLSLQLFFNLSNNISKPKTSTEPVPVVEN